MNYRPACHVTKGIVSASGEYPHPHVYKPSFASSLRLKRVLRKMGYAETPSFMGGRGSVRFEDDLGYFFEIHYPSR